ncbi:MAG: alpha/beta hydrolase, partial [Bacteroidales bacterium]|nr:alpha/beta hydrolase [Bacteroidales bacterium]
MKKTIALLGFVFLMMTMLRAQSVPEGYRKDILGENFISKTIDMADDYEGQVVATLVRTKEQPATGTALLYVHGYNDYFFQAEMAHFFNNNGYRFYALDLRKYGRSKLPHQYPFMVLDLNEYFADIDSAVAQMKREGCTQIALMAHSTGGLITSLYCQENKDRLPFFAIVFNSPFLDMNLGHLAEKVGIPAVARMGKK